MDLIAARASFGDTSAAILAKPLLDVEELTRTIRQIGR